MIAAGKSPTRKGRSLSRPSGTEMDTERSRDPQIGERSSFSILRLTGLDDIAIAFVGHAEGRGAREGEVWSEGFLAAPRLSQRLHRFTAGPNRTPPRPISGFWSRNQTDADVMIRGWIDAEAHSLPKSAIVGIDLVPFDLAFRDDLVLAVTPAFVEEVARSCRSPELRRYLEGALVLHKAINTSTNRTVRP